MPHEHVAGERTDVKYTADIGIKKNKNASLPGKETSDENAYLEIASAAPRGDTELPLR